MYLDTINKILCEEAPENMILQAFHPREGNLSIAFTCDGGPREGEAFVVTFNQVAVFHMPSVLYSPVLFKLADINEANDYIPSVRFDESEFNFNEFGLKIVLITDALGSPTGFYIAAVSVESRWVSQKECEYVW